MTTTKSAIVHVSPIYLSPALYMRGTISHTRDAIAEVQKGLRANPTCWRSDLPKGPIGMAMSSPAYPSRTIDANDCFLDRGYHEQKGPKSSFFGGMPSDTFDGIEIARSLAPGDTKAELTFRLGARFEAALAPGQDYRHFGDVRDFYMGTHIRRLLQAAGGWEPYDHWPLDSWEPEFAAAVVAAALRNFSYDGGTSQWHGVAIICLPEYPTIWRHLEDTGRQVLRIPHVLELITDETYYEATASQSFLISPEIPLISLFRTTAAPIYRDPLRPWGSLGPLSLSAAPNYKSIAKFPWPDTGRVAVITDRAEDRETPLFTSLKKRFANLDFSFYPTSTYHHTADLLRAVRYGASMRSESAPALLMILSEKQNGNHVQSFMREIRSGLLENRI